MMTGFSASTNVYPRWMSWTIVVMVLAIAFAILPAKAQILFVIAGVIVATIVLCIFAWELCRSPEDLYGKKL